MLKQIWTIGHSTRSIEEFLELLVNNKIELLVDVRSFPGSKRFPHFNKENLKSALAENNIEYIHLEQLGGRRKVNPDSKNTAWRNKAFRGYADYMETDEFKEGMKNLTDPALNKRTAYMCSEAVWWRCHRSLISDYLKVNGWKVLHILTVNKTDEHPYTQPAKVLQGELFYNGN
ncbi:MAG: DUF488 domain-containing protein [Ignavibacteriaceae bacterium]